MDAINRKRKLTAMLLMKELMDIDQEEEIIIKKFATFRNEESGIFQNRKYEGMFHNLIKNRLYDEEEKFMNYFRLTRERFYFVLSLVEEELTTSSYNRVKEPITPVEKLALTLR